MSRAASAAPTPRGSLPAALIGGGKKRRRRRISPPTPSQVAAIAAASASTNVYSNDPFRIHMHSAQDPIMYKRKFCVYNMPQLEDLSL